MEVKQAATFLTQSDIDLVQNFAKDTGDYRSLSKVDQMVIALGVRMCRMKGEYNKLKHEPLDLGEFRPEGLKAAYEALSSDSESEEENNSSSGEEAKADEDDEWAEQGKSRQQKRTEKRKQEKREHWEKKQLKLQ